ncbi:MAG: helix-turn-helix transcriptional regulator [Nitrososphaerales archaeon]|nr:helix-turn-helix transcriptional regulator [Nitrososphaerales archaeon]
MPKESQLICMCPLEGVIDVISKKWALLILNSLGNYGKLRYKQIMEHLKISPKILADTLKELQGLGLIRRQAFAEIPPRVEYSLTEDGYTLRRAVLPILQWAAARTEYESCCGGSQGLVQIRKRA